ncbi:uncharacterized protein LOC134440957 [Engraulis encrasicolus]|uniref:uncharacterized protein LOC134440957 n=1 Tax=Engraulis encrasicolus TaxID=184585 RepID=UPI002FD5E65F
MNATGSETLSPAVHAESGDRYQTDEYQLKWMQLQHIGDNPIYCELDHCARCRSVAIEVCGQAACRWRNCLVDTRDGGLRWGLIARTNGEVSREEIPMLIFGRCDDTDANDRKRSQLTELLVSGRFEEALRFAKQVGLEHRSLLLSGTVVQAHEGPFNGYNDCQLANWCKEVLRREREMASMRRRFQRCLVEERGGAAGLTWSLIAPTCDENGGPECKDWGDPRLGDGMAQAIQVNTGQVYSDRWQHLAMITVHSSRFRQEGIPRMIDILVLPGPSHRPGLCGAGSWPDVAAGWSRPERTVLPGPSHHHQAYSDLAMIPVHSSRYRQEGTARLLDILDSIGQPHAAHFCQLVARLELDRLRRNWAKELVRWFKILVRKEKRRHRIKTQPLCPPHTGQGDTPLSPLPSQPLRAQACNTDEKMTPQSPCSQPTISPLAIPPLCAQVEMKPQPPCPTLNIKGKEKPPKKKFWHRFCCVWKVED